MSVTRVTVREVIARLEAGDWEALSEIDAHSVARMRNVRTGSRFKCCIVDYVHVSAAKRGGKSKSA